MKRAAPNSEFISKRPATDAQWTGDRCTIDVDTVTHVSASFVSSPKQTTHISASFASIPAVTASQSSSQQEASSPELSAEQVGEMGKERWHRENIPTLQDHRGSVMIVGPECYGTILLQQLKADVTYCIGWADESSHACTVFCNSYRLSSAVRHRVQCMCGPVRNHRHRCHTHPRCEPMSSHPHSLWSAKGKKHFPNALVAHNARPAC
ncbi:hypothetical protein HaLaN_20634 [Haematococcus lacustris]|uniref:Uncharacterized protein n=1 Tax=Haematococcus lacustris TaxID=44745 RepID=A0A699ZTZ8_HAELA|nr:hypothetical protein HaLaN_20634 [Haematococcus lacustris]